MITPRSEPSSDLEMDSSSHQNDLKSEKWGESENVDGISKKAVDNKRLLKLIEEYLLEGKTVFESSDSEILLNFNNRFYADIVMPIKAKTDAKQKGKARARSACTRNRCDQDQDRPSLQHGRENHIKTILKLAEDQSKLLQCLQEQTLSGSSRPDDSNRHKPVTKMRIPVPCKFFKTSDGCKFGDQCRFLHK